MDSEHVAQPRLAPPLPEAGLRHVLSAWTGEGELYRTLASIQPEVAQEKIWDEAEVRSRADRVLFQRLQGALARWPTRVADWLAVLPPTTTATRIAATHLFPGVNWAETYRRSGWPPEKYHGRLRRREDDTLLTSLIRWAVDHTLRVAAGAETAWPGMTDHCRRQLQTASDLAEIEPLASAHGEPPDVPDLVALRREGHPWGAVAEVATHLRLLAGPAEALAFDLLRPEAVFGPLLFQLGVLGEILLALTAADFRIQSLGPIAGSAGGPAYRVVGASDQVWELWFEAGGVWSQRGQGASEPYRGIATGAGITYRPLRIDILLLRPRHKAIVIECKYPTELGAEYVCRDGFLQAVTYAVEARVLAPETVAVIIGPEGVVTQGRSITAIGDVHIGPPSVLRTLLPTLVT